MIHCRFRLPLAYFLCPNCHALTSGSGGWNLTDVGGLLRFRIVGVHRRVGVVLA